MSEASLGTVSVIVLLSKSTTGSGRKSVCKAKGGNQATHTQDKRERERERESRKHYKSVTIKEVFLWSFIRHIPLCTLAAKCFKIMSYIITWLSI